MLAASQDIDSFIERQRSKLNRQPSRPSANRPIQPQSSDPSNNVQDRLDFRVARILDEPPPHVQSQAPYYQPEPPSPPPNRYINEQQDNNFFQQQEQQRRRLSDDRHGDDTSTFFKKFGTYDDKRSQLKDDLKREYNEYLQTQKQTQKSKSTSQLVATSNNTNKRVQFQQQNGNVVAPWEKTANNTVKNAQSMNNLQSSSSTTVGTVRNEYSNNRSRPTGSLNYDEQYIRDREEYVDELHAQIRELEARKNKLEIESSKLSAGGTSNVKRAHYAEDLNALNSLLEERLDQRNAIDHELAHILNRPPISASPTRNGSGNITHLNMPPAPVHHAPNQRYQQQNSRTVQNYRNDNRSKPNDNGFQIGQENNKDVEQEAKKRYQQELQAQIRETQMKKAQAKQDRDNYERKLEADIERYNYFGRSGGGAPMRDRDGNIVANLADLRNAPPSGPSSNQPQQQQPPPFYPPDNKVYSLGNAPSSISNAPFYNGEQSEQQYPSNSDRSGSPNHARGAITHGLFGTAKTEAQFLREEKYKLELKRQIEEKRQREVEEQARRRAEEERELAKHLEWQQQMEKQMADEALRKQQKEAHEREQQQQVQEEIERQRKQDELERQKKQNELASKRKPRAQPKPATPRQDDVEYGNGDFNRQYNDNNYHHDNNDEPPAAEPVFRSSSPPIPAIKNKGKKPKTKANNAQRPSFDDGIQQKSPPPFPPFNENDNFVPVASPPPPPQPIEDVDSHGQQTYRKPPTPRQPNVSSARKRPTQMPQNTRLNSNSKPAMPGRTNSTISLRSDGSDSEVLNRLEHLKRQLKDKEARLQEHVDRHQEIQKPSSGSQQSKVNHQLSTQLPTQRKQSPALLLNAPRLHHRDAVTDDKVRRMLQTDDDAEFKPGYFRDDTTLMGVHNGNNRKTNGEYYSTESRQGSGNQMFGTYIEDAANRRRFGDRVTNYFGDDDPTAIANYELNRIAEQNELRLKKLRDLEHDDASLLDSNEVLERFQQKQRLQRGASQTTLQDDAWLK